MFDIENLMHLGVFNQLIPIWQVFFSSRVSCHFYYGTA